MTPSHWPYNEQFRRELTDEFLSENLQRLLTQWRDVPYRELIKQTVADLGDEIESSMLRYMCSMDAVEAQAMERLIDEFNILAQKRSFWGEKCSVVFAMVGDRFQKLMQERRMDTEPRVQYAAFQCITFNFATVARDCRGSRKFSGLQDIRLFVRLAILLACVLTITSAFYFLNLNVFAYSAALCFALFAASVITHRELLDTYVPIRYTQLKKGGLLPTMPEDYESFLHLWTRVPTEMEKRLVKQGVLEDPRVSYGALVDKHLMPVPYIRAMGVCAFFLGVVMVLLCMLSWGLVGTR